MSWWRSFSSTIISLTEPLEDSPSKNTCLTRRSNSPVRFNHVIRKAFRWLNPSTADAIKNTNSVELSHMFEFLITYSLVYLKQPLHVRFCVGIKGVLLMWAYGSISAVVCESCVSSVVRILKPLSLSIPKFWTWINDKSVPRNGFIITMAWVFRYLWVKVNIAKRMKFTITAPRSPYCKHAPRLLLVFQ